MKKILLGAVLINLLTACASTPPAETAAPTAEPAAAATTAPAAESATVGGAATPDVAAQELARAEAETAAKIAEEEAARTAEATAKAEAEQAAALADPLNDPASPLAKRDVHFPFDVDAIQATDKVSIKAHGDYLGSHPERKVRTEGNADERGSSEYNLALGQRRANNTKKALVLSGAKAEQIEAISYGEEKPLATAHDESAWAQNRRADLNYR
jgi:peptidoglycan-associated lipoprotein